MKHTSLPLLDYQVFNDSLANIDYKKKQLITTINQYSHCVANNDAFFKKALQKSDILLPDGVGVLIAARLLKKQKIKKIAGADIHQYLLEKVNAGSGTCMYLGTSEDTLAKIKARLAIEFPNIGVAIYSPPFKRKFSKEDNDNMIKAVNAFRPDVLFVGMTAPKQEKMGYAYKKQLDTKTICAIGAVFDFYAGTINRPSQFWISLHLEWFIRLVKEPKRMWRRYLYYGPLFIYLLLKELMKKKK